MLVEFFIKDANNGKGRSLNRWTSKMLHSAHLNFDVSNISFNGFSLEWNLPSVAKVFMSSLCHSHPTSLVFSIERLTIQEQRVPSSLSRPALALYSNNF